jgi:arylsulfatase A-like enzyme
MLAAALLAGACAPSDGGEPPKLLVVIALDQFRASYLEEYDAVFSGGFRRLRDEGRRYDRALADHAPTLSLPGHTTVATGSHPGTHGFNANDWIEALPTGERRRVLVFRDTSARTLGSPNEGGVSTRNLRVTGLADWVRDAHRDARAVALATGTALAMPYGGRPLADESRNHAYWLSERTGVFVTSTYLRSALPDWVARFNETILPRLKADSTWTNTVPQEYRHLARRDDAPYEGDGVHTTFPHRFSDVLDAIEQPLSDARRLAVHSRWFSTGPYGDEALFALAREAVGELALGQRGVTDFLAVAVKSTDRQGHDYGPRSLEQLDILVRLDRLLGGFLEFLDRAVGREHYVVVLTADHGAPNVVEYELEQGRPARRVTQQDIQAVLDRIERFVQAYDGDDRALPEAIARELERTDFIARAMTPAELAGTGPADHILRAYRNTYIPGRTTTYPLWTDDVLYGRVGDAHPVNWGIVVELEENTQIYTARSAHGSAHRYDREVPIVILGSGIRSGRGEEEARTIDVAPTLAWLAGLRVPATVEGRVLDVGARRGSPAR